MIRWPLPDRCPMCRAPELFHSRPRHMRERIASLVMFRPIRCHHCNYRFFTVSRSSWRSLKA